MRYFLRYCGHFWSVVVVMVAELAIVGCGSGASTDDPAHGRLASNDGFSRALDSTSVESQRYLLFSDVSRLRSVTLDLDKQKALSLFGPVWSRQIRLLDVESTVLLENVVSTIRDACGTTWKNDVPNPAYDCQTTTLGRSFGPNWRVSPEFALVRLLGTTPSNVDLVGTSLEDFSKLVDKNPATFRFDFAEVLATTLGIRRKDAIVPISAIVHSLQRNLLGTHPAVTNEGGTLPVSLHDALLDLAPLADKLGTVGISPFLTSREHPGILLPDDATFRTKSNVLRPDFRMRVVASSNLHRAHGIGFSSGAGDMFVSFGKPPLTFDFADKRAFVVEGIEDNPTIDMRFSVAEAPAVAPCAGNPQCRPFFIGNIVREAAKTAYERRVYTRCYVSFDSGCLVGVDIGKQGMRAGFATFTSKLGMVMVPPPQYLWDLLTEVAMVQLHDPTGDGAADIPQGETRPVFALRDIPIGIRGAELVEQMRPVLQSQEREIAEIIAGKYWEHNDDLDVFVMQGLPTEEPYLFFVAPSDLRPDPENLEQPKAYEYRRPGFFSRSDLAESSRISRRTITGVADTEHEKVRLVAGTQVLYAQDDTGDVYELTIFMPDDARQTFPLEFALKNMGRSD